MTSEPADTSVPTPARSTRPSRSYWVPAVVAMAVLLVIGLLMGAGDLQHQAPKSLAGSDVATQISLGIQAQQHDSAPPSVRCPAREPVRAGWRFDCTESARGGDKTVQVVEIDGRGRLSWTISSP